MNCVLAIETSTAQGSIALQRGAEVLFTASFLSARTHNSVIFGPLEEALKLADGLDCIVVGTGPGSYTGVRVGLAVALGVGMSRKVPVIGWTSFAALPSPPLRYAVVGDARREQWHFTEIMEGEMVTAPVLGDSAAIGLLCTQCSLPLYTLDARSPDFCEAVKVIPEARALAALAQRLTPEDVAARAQVCAEPIYLSAPFITTPRSKA